MKTFPMFLKMQGRRVVIIGGGEQAAQKARLMAKTDAQIIIVADEPEPELASMIANGTAEHFCGDGPLFADDVALCLIATGCKGADGSWHAIAKAAGVVVNVVDYPDLCDAYTPSIVDRDPVVVAIGTEGTAPVLGRQIKTRIEELLEPGLGELARAAGNLRPAVAARVPAERRRGFWRWVFGGAPRRVFASGNRREAIALIKSAIDTAGQGTDPATRLSVITTPSEADLLPLRAVQRLQEADLVLHDATCDGGMLELARRDAERAIVPVAKCGEKLDPLAVLGDRLNGVENVVWLCDPATPSFQIEAAHSRFQIVETVPTPVTPVAPILGMSQTVGRHLQ